MTSRLDRLFVLLETGSSGVTRRAAARQLGEVQRLHPHELHHLLARIATYLHSASWETRIAAGQAVEAVVSSLPPWDPPGRDAVQEGSDAKRAADVSQAGRMSFQLFDISVVLANGRQLTGSEGSEYDVREEVLDPIDLRAKMALQRQQLNARLGLDAASKLGVDMSEIFSTEDLRQSTEVQPDANENANKRGASEVLVQAGGLSSREMNRARRKARQAVAKQRSREAADEADEPDKKRSKGEEGEELMHGGESVPDGTGSWGDAEEWPLEGFCDRLFQELFSASWEARHGAATALRDVIRVQGRGAGRGADTTRAQAEQCHQLWLEDAALRLLCVLALDRFGDFVSDQVVAPVRETCAQALGSVLNLMSPEGVSGVLRVLLQLLTQSQWEARHGGLLGLKYLLAVKQDSVASLLPLVYPHVLEGLSDCVDDVGAVAAAALIPVAGAVGLHLPEHVGPTVERLWDLLLDQDELAAACNSFMTLLAAILVQNTLHLGVQPVCQVVPRLWPFLSHSASSVRRATLQTLRTLTADWSKDNGNQWTAELLQDALRHVFQRALVEPIEEIQDIVEQVWKNLVRHSRLDALLVAACPYFSTWLCLAMQPARTAIDPSLLIRANTVPRAVSRRSRAFQPLEAAGGGQELKLYLGGSETTPQATREGNVTRARCMAARMLGLLSCYVTQPAPGVAYGPGVDSPVDCYVKVLLVYLDSRSALQRIVAGLVIAEAASVDKGTEASVDKGTEASADKGTEASADKGTEASVDKGREATVDRETEASADKGREASVDKGNEASAKKGREASVEKMSEASVEKMSEASVEMMSEACVEKESEASIDKESEASADKCSEACADKGSGACFEKMSEVSVVKESVTSVGKESEASVEKESEASVNKISEASADKGSEASADKGTEASVEKLSEASVEKLSEASVDKLSEASIEMEIEACNEKGSEASVEKMSEACVEKESEASVEKMSEASVEKESEACIEKMTEACIEKMSEASVEKTSVERGSEACPEALRVRLHQCLSECLYYDEIAASFTRLLQDARDFVAMLKHYKVPLDDDKYGKVLTLDQIQQLCGPEAQQVLAGCKVKPKVAESLEERRKAIQGAVAQTSSDQSVLSTSTQAALAGAVITLRCLPEKLNPVIKPLMESVKREENEQLQGLAGEHLARLIDLCVDRAPCPNAKIISNLCTFLRSDPEFTPKIQSGAGKGPSSDSGVESTGDGSRTSTPTSFANNYSGILTLVNQQKNAERAAFRRSNSTGGRGPGRPPTLDVPLEELFAVEDTAHKQFRIQRRGATFALTSIGRYFGPGLPARLPRLWDLLVGQIKHSVDPATFDPSALLNQDAAAEELVTCLQVLEVVSPALHASLLPQVLSVSPLLCSLLSHPYRAVRHLSARCLSALAALSSVPVMTCVAARVLPLLGSPHGQGAVEAVACIVDRLQVQIVPYIVLLVVPLLGRMSDPDQCVRLMATHCFATLVQLMPLDGGVPDPPGLPPDLVAHKERERKFLQRLFNPRAIEDYAVPVPIRAQLRSYQQSGVNWLAFLNRYKLHGILCDDMGLGKTLQSICMLAGDHHDRARKYKEDGRGDCAPLPSLVICPPTLTGHWLYEVDKFLPGRQLSPLQYVGPPVERFKLRKRVTQHNLIVASYDIVRKDIDFFSSISWNYVVLDEGHIIKNGKTKSSKAVKQLSANHRLILSGTPIQNNVLELWSLFDFLMPGFLGTEKQFTARYSKPILASRDPKSSPKEQEAGALAMEALHRQVLPFLLRRMKEDVLQDLPPKITQDYYCELSPLQRQLYEDFSRSQAHQSLADSLAPAPLATPAPRSAHVFQALRYLQNVCNHPKLVLTTQHPEHARVAAQLREQNSSLADIHHSAKLPALKQLLLDCGIGVPDTLAINQHRALIFCQLKAMLDILEHDLFRAHMPGVAYLRLDGSVAPANRHAVVTRFNNDPSIDVLLLTTQVGGLGLNLTGADTVIFVEHDWNPMKDVQAMDRAHRIGQKKVVNVYRLITRATLEEKIMGLQKFKLLTANTVISGDNASMETMATDQLLDLFSLEEQKTQAAAHSSGLTMKTVLETLPELWEDRQYEEEYDLASYVRNLNKH